jgi:hypothetical protein
VCKVTLPDFRHVEVHDPIKFMPLPLLGCPAMPPDSFMLIPPDLAEKFEAEYLRSLKRDNVQ